MGRVLIAPLLGDFLRAYPSLSVDLLLVDRNVDLIEEDVHLALRVGRIPDSQLGTRKLAEVRMIHCASPDYLARRGEPQTPSDLAQHDCLVFSDTPGGWGGMQDAHIPVRPDGISGSTAGMRLARRLTRRSCNLDGMVRLEAFQ
jgi:DNA-binding transcriptional LysR family regulator